MQLVSSKRILLACVTVMLFPLIAEADDSGFYAGFAGSLSGADTKFDHTGGQDKAEYDFGGGAIGFAGYKFAFGLRTEVELGIRQNDVSNVNTSILDPDGGETRADTAFVNVIYDFDNSSKFTPYIGGGVGVAHVSHGLVKSVAGDTVHDDYSAFAGQAIAGVSYRMNSKWDVFTDYRYIGTSKHSTSTAGGIGVESTYSQQSINLGIKRRF